MQTFRKRRAGLSATAGLSCVNYNHIANIDLCRDFANIHRQFLEDDRLEQQPLKVHVNESPPLYTRGILSNRPSSAAENENILIQTYFTPPSIKLYSANCSKVSKINQLLFHIVITVINLFFFTARRYA